MEDSLRADGHLGKLARIMGWCESKAGGRLWFFYRHTQLEGIVTDTPERITSAVIVDFDSDEEVAQWLKAMASAKLATVNDDGTYRIHGNEKHVERLANLRGHASSGGKKSQEKKRNVSQSVSSSVSLAQGQASAEHSRTLLAPCSLLPSSSASAGAGASEGNTPPVEQVREQDSKEFEDRPRLLPPQTDSLREITESTIPIEDVIRVVTAYRKAISKRGISSPLMILDSDKQGARRLIAKCGMNADLACDIVTAFVGHNENPWWKKKNWPMYMLADDRDFETAKNLAGIRNKTQPRQV